MTMTIAVDVAARLDLPKIVEEMAGEETYQIDPLLTASQVVL